MAKGKRMRVPVFWICFVLFVALMIVFWVRVIGYVEKCLVIYENSQPEYVMDKVLADMENGALYDRMDFEQSASRFEDGNINKKTYIDSFEGKKFTYEKSAASYNDKKPVYRIYADDTLAAEVTLLEVSSESLMLILTKQEWRVEEVKPFYKVGEKGITITAPDTYSVFINDLKTDARELTGKFWEIEEFKYAREYTVVPKLVEYHAEGMMDTPKVVIYDNLGRQVEYIQDAAGNIRVDTFETAEMDAELKAQVLNNAKNYSNYFSRDVEGCYDSVEPIAGMFPEDSYYLELADNYRREDMWMYSGHETPVFENEKVYDYIMYTPQLFAVNVYFEKNMKLTLNGQMRQDVTNTRFYYAKIDGKWVIVDMQSVLDN